MKYQKGSALIVFIIVLVVLGGLYYFNNHKIEDTTRSSTSLNYCADNDYACLKVAAVTCKLVIMNRVIEGKDKVRFEIANEDNNICSIKEVALESTLQPKAVGTGQKCTGSSAEITAYVDQRNVEFNMFKADGSISRHTTPVEESLNGCEPIGI